MNTKPNYQQLYDIAENQAGYFTSIQAKEARYSWERLSEYSKSGKFRRIEKGIYRIKQYPMTSLEEYFIALLKSGEQAVISHESALTVYNLSDAMPGEIHVTIPRTNSRRRFGIKFHTKKITKVDITVYMGLRVTRIPRMIVDLIESGFDPVQTKEAISQAIKRGFVTKEELLDYSRRKSIRIVNKVSFFLNQDS